jgi:hypothetical protein
MVTTIMKWAFIPASLWVVLLRPAASHQLTLDSLVCAGGFMVVVALFFKSQARDLILREVQIEPCGTSF